MGEIRLITKLRAVEVNNAFNQKYDDAIFEKEFYFESGKIYGIIGEYGEGGELISSLLSGMIPIKREEIYYDGIKMNDYDMQEVGWYVGKREFLKGLVKKEKSVKRALNDVVKKYKRYQNLDEVVEEFHLSPERLNNNLSKYSGERWRASLAIGYASRKKIYCFSWMSTSAFNNILLSSGVFRFFKKMKKEGLTIILPTSRRENVIGLADEIIEINNPSYKYLISEDPYFVEHF